MDSCRFENCDVCGIRADIASYVNPACITDCQFNNCTNGDNESAAIEARDASLRIERCYLNMNDTGILCHAKSVLNMADDANNVFFNRITNVRFTDDDPYETTCAIYEGHNDFYHYYNHQTEETANDFDFDKNYFSVSTPYPIDADGNWFQNDLVRTIPVNDTIDITIDKYDQGANQEAPDPENSRFFTALQYEKAKDYEAAYDLYADIIESYSEVEEKYLPSCYDAIYRLSTLNNIPVVQSIQFFNAEIINCAVSDTVLHNLLTSYLTKLFIVDEDFQSAIDLIQVRIDEPYSTLDSLRAVLDLEIVLQLASFEENKKPITTRYTQYRYPNLSTFNTRHEEHWQQMKRLLNSTDGDTPPPPAVTLYQNYPNPFNPSTTINFSLPKQMKAKLKVYNLKGQLVKELVNGTIPKGRHKVVWDGKNAQGKSAATGIYLIRLDTGGRAITRKAMLLK